MDLTWCFPQPEPVMVGARKLFALPFRLADMARLQGYLKVASPCPLDVARSAIGATEKGTEARRRLLRDAYRACQGWPARLGSEEGRKLLATEEGLRFWLASLLGPCNAEELDAQGLAELVTKVTVPQYETLVRIAYGAAPLDELSRLITPDSFPVGKGDDKPTNWGELIAGLVKETGWTFAQCGDLRITQLAAYRSRGKYGTGKVEPPPGMSRFDFRRRQKRFFEPDREE
jgi:hypothetical protein